MQTPHGGNFLLYVTYAQIYVFVGILIRSKHQQAPVLSLFIQKSVPELTRRFHFFLTLGNILRYFRIVYSSDFGFNTSSLELLLGVTLNGQVNAVALKIDALRNIKLVLLSGDFKHEASNNTTKSYILVKYTYLSKK